MPHPVPAKSLPMPKIVLSFPKAYIRAPMVRAKSAIRKLIFNFDFEA